MSVSVPLKTLFASQVAFWRNQTGAEQRILSLVKYLVAQGYDVETLYCGKLDNADHAAISRHNLTVDPVFQEPEPESVLERVAWESRCTVNWIVRKLRFATDEDDDGGRDLERFSCKTFSKAFCEKLQQFCPQLVVVEYISLAYLASEIPAGMRSDLVLAIDTHDVMHSRYKQFLKAGQDHWIHVTEQQERDALEGFDLVVAIQPAEKKEFERILPGSRVEVVLHSPPVPKTLKQCEAERTTFGYFASANASNIAAIESFLDVIWPRVVAQSSTSPKLVIGGKICEHLKERTIPSCELLGFVEEPQSFYDRVHAIVNPVNFGTGLKIKNLEALAYGKALITSTAGFEGLPLSDEKAFFVADSADSFVEYICQLANDRDLCDKVSQHALKYARRVLHSDRVYGPLIESVDEILGQRLSLI